MDEQGTIRASNRHRLIHVNGGQLAKRILVISFFSAFRPVNMPTRTQLRRLAAYVLLVWLFGLGSGIVNACIVKAQLADAGQAMVHAGHDHAAMSSDSGGHDHQTHHTKPPCERLCDGPPAAPQADHQQANPLSGLWLAAAPVPSSQFQVLASLRETKIGTDARSRAGIPIAIAFLRLTL